MRAFFVLSLSGVIHPVSPASPGSIPAFDAGKIEQLANQGLS